VEIPEGMISPSFEVIGRRDQNLIVKIRDGFASNDVLQFFISKNIQINSFSEMLPSLSDIFIKLVEGTSTARQFQAVQA
jgi:ABC-2 type transport system ATP-binding protein